MEQIVQTYADAVWNTKDLNAIDRYLHEDVVIHSLLGDYKGPQAMRGVVQTWIQGFPDLAVHTIGTFSQKDRVVLQWEANGTHRGEFEGVKPTGRHVAYRGVSIYRVQDGKISEYWGYLDMRHLLSQLF